MEQITALIENLGFPVACVVALGFFIYKIYMVNVEDKKMLLEASNKREDKLYTEIKENRAINSKAIETLSLYADRLSGIETDVNNIKDNISIIKEKIR